MVTRGRGCAAGCANADPAAQPNTIRSNPAKAGRKSSRLAGVRQITFGKFVAWMERSEIQVTAKAPGFRRVWPSSRLQQERERPPGRAPATNCVHEPGGLSLTRPFGPPSPGGRG